MQPDSPYQSPRTFEPARVFARPSNSSLSKRQILFSFQGRIPRRTYWACSLLTAFAFIVPMALLAPLLDSSETALQAIGVILLIPLFITFIWTSLAIRVKRWHDHDKSGTWILIGLIPYAGGLISFIFLGCLRGSLGPNRYGDDPT